MNTLNFETSTSAQRVNISMPSLWLRLEGLTLFIGAIAVYAYLGLNGWWFLVLLLVPDLAMIGYLRNPQIGAFTYNLAHNYALPLVLLAIAFATTWQTGIMLGLIWVAHISMDRVVGYGLKYGSNFKDTHLQKL